MTLKHKKQTLLANDPAKDISANAWNDDHAIADGLDFPEENPVAPPANTVRVFGRKVGGRMMPAFKGPSGLDSSLQPSFARNRIAMWLANGNSTAATSFGLAATSGGTATAASVTTTSIVTAIRRLDYLVTTAATTAIAFLMPTGTINQLFRGTGALGGFHIITRFGGATGMTNASHRFWAGLSDYAGNPTDAEPSSRSNLIGVGYDSTDSNWQIMHKTGTGAVTKINLGASFPRQTVDRSKMYELVLFCPPAGTTVFYEFIELGSSNVASGEITTNLPAATSIVRPSIAASVGGVSSVIGITVASVYIETDY